MGSLLDLLPLIHLEMIDKVIKTIEDHALLSGVSRLTVALSGGADSVALLHILNQLKDKYNFSLNAIHFNHCIRGEEALRDQSFSQKLCESLGVPLITGCADVPKIAKESRESIELCARRLRYDFLKKNANGTVATAHTASDNIETVIFNLTRGTSIKGLCGIPIKRDNFIRPLINCNREEIENYCKKNSLEYVTDSTNLCDMYSRNNIRHNVVPILKEINPCAETAVLRMTESLREDVDYFESIVNDLFLKLCSDNKLYVADFNALHPSISKRILAKFLRNYFADKIDNFHLNALYSIALNGGKLSLFDKKTAYCDKKHLFIANESEFFNPKYNYIVEIKKENANFFENFEKINGLLLNNLLDCDKISGKLRQRNRQEGDSVFLYKRNGTKSLKKIFTEHKVPLSERAVLPILCDDLGIVWIFGIGVANRCAIDNNTKFMYKITSYKTKLGG